MLASRRLGSDPQIQKASTNNPSLKRGSEGSGVAIIQDLLADLGYVLTITLAHGKADGIFGSETEAAVKSFQKSKGLQADGIVGAMTLKALDAEVLANARLEEKVGRQDLHTSYW